MPVQRMTRTAQVALWLACVALPAAWAGQAATEPGAAVQAGLVISLDGTWSLATDPQNVGREQKWWEKPVPEAKKTQVPWIIQDAFPGYHGVAWYWREFVAPANPHPDGRTLLRFWAVDYQAEVWLNGARAGEHEDGEEPFVLDVTGSVKPQGANLLAVRVLNPTHAPIDGIVLSQTPHRNKVIPYSPGSSYNHGGIVDSVELLLAPAVRVEDLFVRPDPKTGMLRIQANVRNAGPRPAQGHLEFTAAPAASGETVATAATKQEFKVGDTRVESQLRIESPRLWELNDPFLYRVTARVWTEPPGSLDERSVRCGFREFRFDNGCFRLNGRRLFLRCSHTGNHCPIGLQWPHDPDLLRRDLLNAKAMRFNAIRFIAGVATRDQLDLCDEIGLMVYEEPYASWCLADSPKMAERYDRSVAGMVRRDRNHPSVVMWGLLNETPDGPVFRHAVAALPLVRSLDDSRIVMLNSARSDGQAGGDSREGLEIWRMPDGPDPCVTHNGTTHGLSGLGVAWAPGQLAFHPGSRGQYSVVRWTAPADGPFELAAAFASIAQDATTDVHVLHNGQPLYEGFINVKEHGPEAAWSKALAVKAGDKIDFAVGWGNANHGGDTTALAVTIKGAGKTHDAAADFSLKQNPSGFWSYGYLAGGPSPDSATFKPYPLGERLTGAKGIGIGSLSNPGSSVWEDVLSDQHPYQRAPHTAGVIRTLRTLGGGGRPLFVSEYGIGSAVHLARVVRLYEQVGKGEVEDARFYRAQRDAFLGDWERWRLAECFASPEDYFAECVRKMAAQRLLGLNALRANPALVGHSLTGTVDQGMSGEGCWTTFRELKPGAADALFDGFAPLRLCLFVEPVNVYRKAPVRLEAVLANEDALSPGEYPVRVQVVGPNVARVFERVIQVKIPAPRGGAEPAFAQPVFAESIVVDGPSGRYRFLATFERGAAAAGGETEFYVADPAEMPPVPTEVVLWGEDDGLSKWLTDHGIRTRPFGAAEPAAREVILASGAPPAPGGAGVFRALVRRIARGSSAVFLSPAVFAEEKAPTRWLPLKNKGTVGGITRWLYLSDDWAKRHPIFDGLPAGGLMDYTFYRELIPDAVWSGQDAPAEAVAGANNTSLGYSAGLLVSVYDLGAGRFVLNSLRIRENLGGSPVAERLLRNMLRYAARDVQKPPADLPAEFEAALKALGY